MKQLIALLLVLTPLSARAERRFALVIGANQGKHSQPTLHFAEQDARRISSILASIGRFHPADVRVLTDSNADAVREAFDDLEQRMSRQESLLFVFYSGHADGASLNLGSSNFPLDELKDRVVRSSAAARVLVIDACRSGVLTRVKGGWPGPAFEVPDAEHPAQGLAILASSAAGEEAQESEQLGASFFTHFFASGLLGAADRNGDLAVTLGETFEYAAERTVAATNETAVGPQHPTYRVELRGRDDLVLTNLTDSRRDVGMLEFSEAGGYLIAKSDLDTTVAEVTLAEGEVRRVAVGAGRYRVTRRASDHLLVGEFDVQPDARTGVREDQMTRLAYARMVRKGSSISTAFSAIALGGVRTSMLDSGVAWQIGAGARWDLEWLALEGRVDLGGASQTNGEVHMGTRELGLSIAGLRAFDVGPLTLEIGAEVGGVWFHQSFADRADPRDSFGGLIGPIGVVQLPIDRFCLRLEVALPIYLLRVGNEPTQSGVDPQVTFRSGLGAGLYF